MSDPMESTPVRQPMAISTMYFVNTIRTTYSDIVCTINTVEEFNDIPLFKSKKFRSALPTSQKKNKNPTEY